MSLVVTATPGTGALFTVAAGLAGGSRAATVAAVGCTLGIVPHLLLAASGAALLLAGSPTAYRVLTWAGIAYLLWMAWSTWRGAGVMALDRPATSASSMRVVATAVGVNLLNPKLTLFFFAFLPQFVGESDDASGRMLVLGGAFMLVTLTVFVGYGLAASAAREAVMARPRVLRWTSRVLAVSFVALGARLALA